MWDEREIVVKAVACVFDQAFYAKVKGSLMEAQDTVWWSSHHDEWVPFTDDAVNELVVSRRSSNPTDKFDHLRKMKLKSFKDLETTSKVRTKDLVLP